MSFLRNLKWIIPVITLLVSSLASADIDAWFRKEPFFVGKKKHAVLWYRLYVGAKANSEDASKFKAYYIGAQADEGTAYYKDGEWSQFGGGLPAPVYTGHANLKEWYLGSYPADQCPFPSNNLGIAVGYGVLDEAGIQNIAEVQSKSSEFSYEHLVNTMTSNDMSKNDKTRVVLRMFCYGGVPSGW